MARLAILAKPVTKAIPFMRVLHIITGLGQGGAEAALYRLLDEHRRMGIDSHVISFLSGGFYAPLIREIGVPVEELGGFRPLRALRSVNRIDPDILQLWTYYPLSLTPAVRRRRIVWAIRCSLQSLPTEKLHQKAAIMGSALIARQPDVIVYNSEQGRADHEVRLRYPGGTGMVIPNGFNANHFAPDVARRQSIREELGISQSTVVIGNLARFHKVKNHEMLLRAGRILAKKGFDFRLALGGSGIELANPAFESLVRKHEVKDRCIALGAIRDTPRFFDLCDIYVNCSTGEGFPNVVGEAMAMSLPVIGTDVGDTRSLIGDAGSVVPSDDANALVRELTVLLQSSAEARATIGRGARARIECAFTSDVVGKRYARLYRDLHASE